jgi:two-component system nitrate/nitrite response regulator NarL
MTGPQITIAVIDDHPLFREGVIRSLEETGRFKVVGEGGSAADAIRVAREARPDIVLIDLSMPGEGLSAIAPIREHGPDIRIVALTASEAAEDVTRALNGGVNGYVLKGVGSRALTEILCAVAEGETYVTPSLSARLLSRLSAQKHSPIATDPIRSLTGREREVLEFVAAGLSNKEIAIRLDLQEKTVKHHMTAILTKLRASNRTAAAMKLQASAPRAGRFDAG